MFEKHVAWRSIVTKCTQQSQQMAWLWILNVTGGVKPLLMENEIPVIKCLKENLEVNGCARTCGKTSVRTLDGLCRIAN